MANYDQDLRFCRNDCGDFEYKNLLYARNERTSEQRRAFEEWINAKIKDSGLTVKDLFADLRDGKVLHALLSTLTNSPLPPLTKGTLKIHMLENVKIVLDYLKIKQALPINVGPEDVVDGNPKIIMGLVWAIILYYQDMNRAEFYSQKYE